MSSMLGGRAGIGESVPSLADFPIYSKMAEIKM